MTLARVAAPDFDLALTLQCGQVFHWRPCADGFMGAIGDEAVYVEQRGGELRTNAEPRVVARYFALDHPLAKIYRTFPKDPAMAEALSFCRGLRIIRQPAWECVATFITSSMKQVAHIAQISHTLRRRFGKKLVISGGARVRPPERNGAQRNAVEGSRGTGFKAARRDPSTSRRFARDDVFGYPTPERIAELSEKDLRECALGYRAKNLLASARMIASGEVDLNAIAAMPDVEARAELMRLRGVGEKVANCVLLFAYERVKAFPIDVWIERVLRETYFPRKRRVTAKRLRDFSETYFGAYGGYAQQYLFHHARSTRKNKERGGTRAAEPWSSGAGRCEVEGSRGTYVKAQPRSKVR